jgi:hypothetical protein
VDVAADAAARGQVAIIETILMEHLRLSREDIARKLVAAAFDGAKVYQGVRAGVGVLIQASSGVV